MVKLHVYPKVWENAGIPDNQGAPVAGDQDKPDTAFDDEASRLTNGLQSCRNLLANYRAMLTESSNDNPVDDLSGDDSKLG